MRRAVNESSVVGALLIATGAFVIHQAFQIPVTRVGGWGPRAFPVLAAGGVILAGALVLWSSLRAGGAPGPASAGVAVTEPGPEPEPGPSQPEPERGAALSVLALIALGAAYVWALDKIGYLVATALVTPVAFWIFGVRRPLGLLAAAVICPLAYQVIFFELLRVFPPRGEWFDLLDWLRY